MKELKLLFDDCSASFKETEEYRILENYRNRYNRLTFDERLAITKSVDKSFGPFFDVIREDVPALTDSDLLFCALSTQGFETVAIAECMTVTKEAVRSRKFRLREKMPSKWLMLLFPEQANNNIPSNHDMPINETLAIAETIQNETFQNNEENQNETFQKEDESAHEISLPSQLTENTHNMKETMSFGKAVVTCFSKYFTLKGRARRSEYWYFFLFCFLLRISWRFFRSVIDGSIIPLYDDSMKNLLENILTSIWCIIKIGLAIPFFTVTVRRLHDRDSNGWLAIILFLVPIFVFDATGFILLFKGNDLEYMYANGGLSPFEKWSIIKPLLMVIVINFIFLLIRIIILSKPGTEGPNSYGQDPIHIIPDTQKKCCDSY